ncbi:9847_t:CDS:2, partial [Gigaspora rosea]
TTISEPNEEERPTQQNTQNYQEHFAKVPKKYKNPNLRKI